MVGARSGAGKSQMERYILTSVHRRSGQCQSWSEPIKVDCLSFLFALNHFVPCRALKHGPDLAFGHVRRLSLFLGSACATVNPKSET